MIIFILVLKLGQQVQWKLGQSLDWIFIKLFENVRSYRLSDDQIDNNATRLRYHHV